MARKIASLNRLPGRPVSLLLLALMLLIVAVPGGRSQAAPWQVNVVVDGKPLSMDPAPVLSSGRILVPLRAIFEAMGATVLWEGHSRTITGIKGARVVVLTIDSVGATVNGNTVVLDAPPTIVDGRTMVPLRFISESMGARVEWDEGSRTASVTSLQADKVLRIGLIASLSGEARPYGESLSKGFQFYLDEQQGRLGSFQAQVITADDGSTPDGAAAAATRLITGDGVDVLVGSDSSDYTMPITGVVQQYHIPLIAPCAPDTDITTDDLGRKDYVFRSCVADDFQGAMGARFALQRLDAKTAAVLFPASDYGVELAEGFRSEFENGNGDVTVFDIYDQGSGDQGTAGQGSGDQGFEDLDDALQDVVAAQPDVLYLPGFSGDVNVVARQARSLGITAVFLGGSGWSSPLLDYQALDGGYFTGILSINDPGPAMKDWFYSFGKQYRLDPDDFSLAGYDAALVLGKAVAAANSNDPEDIKKALGGVTDVAAPGGNLSIDDSGDAVMPVPVFQVQNGAASYYMTIYPGQVLVL